MTDSIASEPAEPDEARPRNAFLIFLRDLLVILLIAFLVSFVVKTFLVRSFYIPSGSMKDTLQVDDRILVNQLSPQLMPVDRGDVIVFTDPGGWLTARAVTPPTTFEWILQQVGLLADTSEEYVIKRVIGLPGDTVECCNPRGQLSVNGTPIKEPYVLLPEAGAPVSKDDFSVEVPAGSYWVMGDNRYASKDSRYNRDTPGKGFVLEKEIVGRAFVINWPFSRFGWLGSYPESFAGVPDAPVATGG